MTKKKSWAVALLFMTIGCYFFLKKEQSNLSSKTQPLVQKSTPQISKPAVAQNVKIETPKAIGRFPASTGYSVNLPSNQWQERLESSFKEQAGDGLKKIDIRKEKSFIWNKDNIPLHVEMVVIKLTNQQDVESSFRAIVDSQTGKVLETWDRTIFDPADMRAGVQIKLDPRYSN